MDERSADPVEQLQIPRTIGGFLLFTLREIVRRRKWILVPFWLVLCLLGAVIFLLGGSYLLPAIYIAF